MGQILCNLKKQSIRHLPYFSYYQLNPFLKERPLAKPQTLKHWFHFDWR